MSPTVTNARKRSKTLMKRSGMVKIAELFVNLAEDYIINEIPLLSILKYKDNVSFQ
jgi:hypothetical protein